MLAYYANKSFTLFVLTVDSHPCGNELCNTSGDDDDAELVVLAEESKNLQHTLSAVT
jgi:hypothetical protein